MWWLSLSCHEPNSFTERTQHYNNAGETVIPLSFHLSPAVPIQASVFIYISLCHLALTPKFIYAILFWDYFSPLCLCLLPLFCSSQFFLIHTPSRQISVPLLYFELSFSWMCFFSMTMLAARGEGLAKEDLTKHNHSVSLSQLHHRWLVALLRFLLWYRNFNDFMPTQQSLQAPWICNLGDFARSEYFFLTRDCWSLSL